MKALISLADHNARHCYTMPSNEPVLNGIGCPECAAELFDSEPMITLTSMPAQKRVHCSACDYLGTRLA